MQKTARHTTDDVELFMNPLYVNKFHYRYVKNRTRKLEFVNNPWFVWIGSWTVFRQLRHGDPDILDMIVIDL